MVVFGSRNRKQIGPIMIRKTAIAPVVFAGLAGGFIALAPVASATTSLLADGPTVSSQTGAPVGDAHNGTDPLVPYGTDPSVPVRQGYIDSNHDEANTSNGEVDLGI
jgi:hypothetical protein